MRRWLLVALLFLLPAQFLWAAVAPYCAHEAAPVSYHLGHHAHEHSYAPDSEQDPDRSAETAGLGHPDCNQCHSSHAQFGSDLQFPPTLLPAGGFAGPVPQPYGSKVEPDIDRPKWTRAV